ncbi:copper chaperone PCu(A)C [Paracoccus caeni]|uniref:Copper chaperone PCu(A)C n=1 Tax=Paracoccus caeni TaxID=657651 RepID=A0A934S962_9RHOB|nr:copper chaperone PCu(A)C [Paracoccus caeni]MBK4214670.1 copper chaperone PCu(A)C [Paracoccus caeni]
MNRIALTTALAALLPLSALAHDGVAVRDAYVLSSNPKTAAAFMQLENHREVECRLTGASSDTAERVELHTHVEENGMMKMTHVEEGFAVAPRAEHALERGGDHIMMMGVKEPLDVDDVVKLKLDFGDCGTLDVEAPVVDRTPEASAEAAEDHSGH